MKRKKKMKILIFTLVIVAILGVIYMLTVVGESQTTEGKEKQDIEQLVYDYRTDRLTKEPASDNSNELVVTQAGVEETYKLPEEAFFV
ncbi:hypothetical protein CUC15_04935 [Oceanobacillus zhaokaii]|uniref:Uncharacterized protein n=2 Tax=Oceanobacillus zhaokaii TaxID=2052660 RepID=A0A345PE85_9BACI|nr:hypothetical protein CUC15_04935 [Oceanobacillus zhaokaii]